MRLRVGASTHRGRVRDLNEDVYIANIDRGLFLVCDGMGGAPAGEVASKIAADTVLEELSRSEEATTGSADSWHHRHLFQTTRFAAAVQRCNQVIYERARADERKAKMGTTLVGAWIHRQIASVAHVGDSRAYLWHNNALERLTCDHSLIEEQIRAGLLEREGAEHAPLQHVLVRALGREQDVAVDVTEVPLQAGDYLLLCSDGLTRMVPDGEFGQLFAAVRDPQAICDRLVDAANRNGGADNITVVVVEVRGNHWQRLSALWNPARQRSA